MKQYLKMSNINERIEIFKGDISDLRKEVRDIKETLMQQNELILSLLLPQTRSPLPIDETEPNSPLSTQIEKVEPIIKTENVLPYVPDDTNIFQFNRNFPIKSFEELNEFEMKLNDENKTHIVNIIKSLLSPDGIYRKIANVLSYNIIMESNVNGRHYKTNLLNFPKTMNALFLASRTSYSNYNQFLDELKRSIRLAQNRRHTRNCSIKRKLSREQKTQEMPYEVVKSRSFVRTQETYFPPYS